MKGTKRGFLEKLKSIPTLSFGQGLVLHFSSSGKNLECQKLSGGPSMSNPVSGQKHRRTCSVSSDDSITSICSFQSFYETMESPTSLSMGKNEGDEQVSTGMSISEMVKCPPGGENSVILYTTSLTGIRKTFEDCSAIRFLLRSFKIKFYERDVSMDLELRNELWKVMGERVIPPCLFIKGKYIGGADEVVGLHEQGKLHKLLHGILQVDPQQLDQPCENCFNVGFVLCSVCNGSCKVLVEDETEVLFTRCSYCNENGLVRCIACS